jgi:hypothetical protein
MFQDLAPSSVGKRRERPVESGKLNHSVNLMRDPRPVSTTTNPSTSPGGSRWERIASGSVFNSTSPLVLDGRGEGEVYAAMSAKGGRASDQLARNSNREPLCVDSAVFAAGRRRTMRVTTTAFAGSPNGIPFL